ncbi:MAG: class I SAM-dependent methyltransferase [Halobacteriota archaeon]
MKSGSHKFRSESYDVRKPTAVIGFVVARERYIDDYLRSCIDGGLEQLVILGTGYDSRAYRFEGLKRAKVFEVDHPATQRIKVVKLKTALGKLPENVVFVSIDFIKETLGRRLNACGYDNRLKNPVYLAR